MSKEKKKQKPIPFIPEVLKDAILARLDDTEGSLGLPVLHGCLVPVYELNELKRQAAKLTISVEGAHWLLRLDCPGEKISARFASASLVTCLAELNEALGRGHIVWSPMYERNKKALPTVDALIQ